MVRNGTNAAMAVPADMLVGESQAMYECRTKAAGPKGLKFDGGKPRFSLLRFGCARAIAGVVAVLTFGARKYAAHSWREVDEGVDRYWSAMERHMNRMAIHGLDSRDLNENGEVDENHSGELDVDHMNTNGMFLAELIRTKYGIKH